MPVLTQQQRKEIGKAKQYHGVVQHLAAKYNVTCGVIRRWRKEGKKLRPNWADQPGRGRKPVLNSVQKQCMKRSAKKRKTARQIKNSYNQKHPKGN
jgi:transposase